MRKILIVLFALMLYLSGCTSGNEVSLSPPEDGVLRYVSATDIESIDPAYLNTTADIMAAALVYEGLVRNKNDQIVPAAAASWTKSTDGLTYYFVLRDDVYFHNGRQVIADDLKFSFERQLRLKTPNCLLLANIVGAEAVFNGQTNDLVGITCTDDFHLQITLKEPDDNFLYVLATPTAVLLDRYELVSQGAQYAKGSDAQQLYPPPSGTGPYRISEYYLGKSLSLGSFEDYYGGEPQPKRLELFWGLSKEELQVKLQSGQLDAAEDGFLLDAFADPSASGFTKVNKNVRSISYLAIKADVYPFDNQALRQAVFAAVIPQDLANAARDGNAFFCPGEFSLYWSSLTDDLTSFGVSKPSVRVLLAEAGIMLPIDLTLHTSDSVEHQLLAEQLTEDLAEYQINLTVITHSARELAALVRNGEVAFYLRDYTDKGGGISLFFNEAIGLSTPVADYSFTEKELKQNGRFYPLYYKKTATLVNQEWQKLSYTVSGGLDLSGVYQE